MCEIAVVDPEQTSIEIAQQLAYTFYEEQQDGLGVLAVHDTGDKYEYESYKSVEPHWQTLYSFLKREWSDSWRVIIHGRAGTSGGVKRSAAHPIEVDCDACDFDYVIHNGSVRDWRQQRASLISHGHDFTGSVDTEVIPHKVEELPESVENLSYNTYNITGNLNYLLFSEDGILARVTRKYDLTEDFRMTCRYSDVKEHGFDSGRERWMIARPGEDIESKKSKYVRNGNSTGASNYQTGRGYNPGARRAAARNRAAERFTDENAANDESAADAEGSTSHPQAADDQVTISYTDQLTTYDYLSAIKVAPGVIKIIDRDDDDSTFVFRSEHPRLYYWYSPEEMPENVSVEELERAADKSKDAVADLIKQERDLSWSDNETGTEQQSLDEVADERDDVEDVDVEAVADAEAARSAAVVADQAPEDSQVEVGEGIKQLFDGMDA